MPQTRILSRLRPALLPTLALIVLATSVTACCALTRGLPGRGEHTPTSQISRTPWHASPEDTATPTRTRPSATPSPTSGRALATPPDRSPTQEMRVKLHEDELARAIVEAVEADPNIQAEDVVVRIHPDGVDISGSLELGTPLPAVDISIGLLPTVENGALKLNVTRLELGNCSPLLAGIISPLVRDLLGEKLDLLDALQRETGESFELSELELHEGYLILRGVSG